MKLLLSLIIFGMFGSSAFASEPVKKTYRFSLEEPTSERGCCAPRLFFQNLGRKGIDLGSVSLKAEEDSFIAVAEYGVARTTLYTSVESKVEGTVRINYVFKCSPSKNTGCPKSGKISVPFSMRVKCGNTDAKVYVEDYDWEPTGLQLAKMITERPDDSGIQGKAHVSLRTSKRCS